ncbi:MAG: GIY-YIG nuclease family protein, partial [Saprospiraceae bacterium]
HFGIHAERSHRALDDTLATVHLFELILAAQEGETLRSFVNNGVKETKLPQNITLARLHEVPDSCGVYYLHGESGEVIYVGKSLNIRKRLFEHFADLTPKGEKLRTGVVDLSYEVTGSELMALLLESAEIKRLQPRVNRTQRIRQHQGAIFSYLDEQGYRRLVFGKPSAKNLKNLELVSDYPKLDHAKNHLLSLVRQHELCYRLSHLDQSEHACFHYAIKKCSGACIGLELPADYNLRVEEALTGLRKKLAGNYFIIDEGRSPGEKVVVGVLGGQYMGYGFVENDLQMTVDDLLETLNPPPADPQACRIIQTYLQGHKRIKVVPF